MCISMSIVCVDERHLTIHSTLRQHPALFVLEFSMTTHKRVHRRCVETRKCFQNKPPRPFYINKSKTTWSRACLVPDLYARILLLRFQALASHGGEKKLFLVQTILKSTSIGFPRTNLSAAGLIGRQRSALILCSSARMSRVTYETIIVARYPELDSKGTDEVYFGTYLADQQAAVRGDSYLSSGRLLLILFSPKLILGWWWNGLILNFLCQRGRMDV